MIKIEEKDVETMKKDTEISVYRFGLPYNPQKEKKLKNKIVRQIALVLLFLLVLVALITIAIEGVIQNHVSCLAINDTIDSTWIGSVASYWGGIIGGIISGAFAFIGVYFTIRYYKDSDDEKQKAAIQPFLNVTIGTEKRATRGFRLGKEPEDKGKDKDISVTIKNIGNGFANTIVIHTGFNRGGLEFNNVIAVGESVSIYFVVDSVQLSNGVHFGIQFIDSMRNEYIQEYVIVEERGHNKIECGYPGFLEQS